MGDSSHLKFSHTVHSSTPWVDAVKNPRASPRVRRQVSMVEMEYPGLYPALRARSPLPELHPMLSRKGKFGGVMLDTSPVPPTGRNEHDRKVKAQETSQKMMKAPFDIR